jgi:hypothetical protein
VAVHSDRRCLGQDACHCGAGQRSAVGGPFIGKMSLSALGERPDSMSGPDQAGGVW